MKVVLVDDEGDIRRIAKLALARIGGFDVTDFGNSQEALEAAAALQPDVVVLDVMMPGQDGPSTLLALRADARTAHIPVIFLTAKAMPSEIQRLTELGAKGVLIKPFDPTTLAAQVRALLGT